MKKVKAMLLSVGVMTAVSAAVLALVALISAKSGALPKGLLPVITTLVSCLAVLLGGFFASMYARERGILFGVFSGLLFLICIALVSSLAFQNLFGLGSLGKAAAILISGSIGGILGVNRKTKVKF